MSKLNYIARNQLNSMFLSPTSTIDIINIIKLLKNTNSVGYDDVTTEIINTVANIIAPTISYIVSLYMEQGIFPDRLKLTITVPIFKKDVQKLLMNYRPIALISIFSKIIENVIHDKLNTFFETNNLFTKHQYGFRKNRSINMAI